MSSHELLTFTRGTWKEIRSMDVLFSLTALANSTSLTSQAVFGRKPTACQKGNQEYALVDEELNILCVFSGTCIATTFQHAIF